MHPMRATLATDFFVPPRPRVIAHRGASGIRPENTLEAFRAAVEARAPYIELDVHMTNDGVVVVSHDDNLKRVSGRDVPIAQSSCAEVAAADAGFNFGPGDGEYPFRGKGLRVPTLEEVLKTFAGELFVVEVKQTAPSLVRAMLDVIERTGMSRRVLVASEHQAPLDEVRALAPGIPTNFSAGEVAAMLQAMARHDRDYRAPADSLQVPPVYESWRLVTPEIVDEAHRVGVEVHVWTVNAVAEMREMLDLGVDGIITNYPARLLRLL
jgi:glycerophosphoryl diester phosphodiesterase